MIRNGIFCPKQVVQSMDEFCWPTTENYSTELKQLQPVSTAKAYIWKSQHRCAPFGQPSQMLQPFLRQKCLSLSQGCRQCILHKINSIPKCWATDAAGRQYQEHAFLFRPQDISRGRQWQILYKLHNTSFPLWVFLLSPEAIQIRYYSNKIYDIGEETPK
jgi:hypothetical protein